MGKEPALLQPPLVAQKEQENYTGTSHSLKELGTAVPAWTLPCTRACLQQQVLYDCFYISQLFVKVFDQTEKQMFLSPAGEVAFQFPGHQLKLTSS